MTRRKFTDAGPSLPIGIIAAVASVTSAIPEPPRPKPRKAPVSVEDDRFSAEASETARSYLLELARDYRIAPDRYSELTRFLIAEASMMFPGTMAIETDLVTRTQTEKMSGRVCAGFGKSPCGVPWFRVLWVRRGEVAFHLVSVHDPSSGTRVAKPFDGERYDTEDGTF